MAEKNIDDTCSAEASIRVVYKQVQLVYDNQPLALLATFVVVAALLLVFLSPAEGAALCNGYFLAFLVVILLRAYLNLRYFSNRKKNTVDVNRAKSYYLLGIIMTGITWSAMIISLFPVLGLSDQILLLISVLGFTAAAHTTMGFVKAASIIHSFLLISAMAYAVYNSEFPSKEGVLIAIILFFIFVLRSSLLFYSSILNMLCLNEMAAEREQKLELQTAEANSANQEKSKFLSRMSHELRTPLNAILGMNELLLNDKNEPLTGKQSSRAKKVAAAGEHLLSIVDDVLDLSCIESGNVDVKPHVMDCQAVINDSIKLIENIALTRDVVLHTDLPNATVHIMADSKRIKQVLVNLLDNGVKYNKHGGRVTVMLQVKAESSVRISVIDTGYGIPDDSLDDLFKPFSRLGADELGIDGTGIGLSLCKQLIELMEGKIGVDSNCGKGCCFWIELPYVEATEIVDVEVHKEVPPVYANPTKDKKILLVEDNLVNCEVAMDMLEEIGFAADVVNNGQQALDLLGDNQYALILMDCEMPILDGFATTEKIRQHEIQLQQSRIPIIALTAHAIDGARDRCMASGMDDFLSKPFGMVALQQVLSRWLQKQSKDDLLASNNTIGEAQPLYAVASNGSNTKVVFDESVINRLCNRQKKDGSQLLQKVVNIYFEQSSKLLDNLRKATQQSDIESIKIIAHTLKSSSMNVGASGLSLLCKKLEFSCKDGKMDTDLINQVQDTYLSVELALKERLQRQNKSF